MYCMLILYLILVRKRCYKEVLLMLHKYEIILNKYRKCLFHILLLKFRETMLNISGIDILIYMY